MNQDTGVASASDPAPNKVASTPGGMQMPRIPSASAAARRPQTCDAAGDALSRDPRRRELLNLYSPPGKGKVVPSSGRSGSNRGGSPRPQADALPVLVEKDSGTTPCGEPQQQPNRPTTSGDSQRRGDSGNSSRRKNASSGSRGSPPTIPASAFQTKSHQSTFLPSRAKDPFCPKPPTRGSAMKLQASVETVKLMFFGSDGDNDDDDGSTEGVKETKEDGTSPKQQQQPDDMARRMAGLRKLASFVPPNYTEPSIREAHKMANLKHQFDPVTKKPRRRHFALDVAQDAKPTSKDLDVSAAVSVSRRTREEESDLPTCIAVEDMGNDPVSLAVVDGFIEATPGLREVRLGQLDERYAMVLRNVYKAVSRNVSIEQVTGSFPDEAAQAFKATLDGNQERREQRLHTIERRKRERRIAEMEEQILWERQERKRIVLNTWRQRMGLIEQHKKFHKDTLQQEHTEWKELSEEISKSYETSKEMQRLREERWFAAVAEIEKEMYERRDADEACQQAIVEQMHRDEVTERYEIQNFLRVMQKKQNDERHAILSEQFEARKAVLREEKACRRPLEHDMHTKIAAFMTALHEQERQRQEAQKLALLEEARAIERAKRVEREHVAFFGQEVDRRKLIDAECYRLLDAIKRKYFEGLLNAKNIQRIREQQELHEREFALADTSAPRIHFRMATSTATFGASGTSGVAPGSPVASPLVPFSIDPTPPRHQQPANAGVEAIPYTMNAVGDLLVLNSNCVFSVKLEGAKKLSDEQKLIKAEPRGGSISVCISRVGKAAPGSQSPAKLLQFDNYTGTEGIALYIPDAPVGDGNVEVNGYIPHAPDTVLTSVKEGTSAEGDAGGSVGTAAAPAHAASSAAADGRSKKAQNVKTPEQIEMEKRLAELCGDDRVFGRLSVRNEVLPEDRLSDVRARRKLEKKRQREEEERIRNGKIAPRPRRQLVSWNGDDIGVVELGYAGGPIESDRLQSYYVNDEAISMRTSDIGEKSVLSSSMTSNDTVEVFRMDLLPGVSRHAISEVLGHLAFFSFSNSGFEDTSEPVVRITTSVTLDYAERSTKDEREGDKKKRPSSAHSSSFFSDDSSLIPTVTVRRASVSHVRLTVPFFAASTIDEPLFCLEGSPPVELVEAFAFMLAKPDGEVVRWCDQSNQATEHITNMLGNGLVHGMQIVLSILRPGHGDIFVCMNDKGTRVGSERTISSTTSADTTRQPATSRTALGATASHAAMGALRRRSTFGAGGGGSSSADQRKVVRELLHNDDVIGFVEGPLINETEYRSQQNQPTPSTPAGKYAETRIMLLSNRATTFAALRDTILSLRFGNLAKDPSTAKRHIDITVIDKKTKHSCISRRVICIVPVDDITEITPNVPEWGFRVYRSQCDTRADLQQYLPSVPFFVAPNMTVVDPDSRFFEGGYLEVEIVRGAKDGDCLFITDTPGIAIERANKWDLKEMSKLGKAAAMQQAQQQNSSLSGSQNVYPQSTKSSSTENPNLTPIISIDILGVSGLMNNNECAPEPTADDLYADYPMLVVTVPDRGSEDSDSDYESTRVSRCYVSQGLAVHRLPGAVSRKEIRRERRTTSVCLGDEQADDDPLHEESSSPAIGGMKRDLGLSFMMGSAELAKMLAKQESAQGQIAFASTKLRIEFRRMPIDGLQHLVRHIAFKACAATERSDHYNGMRTIQFRAIVGDPTVKKFRKYDPFVPIVAEVNIEVCEPLLQNSPQTVTYKEGSGAVPIPISVAQDGAPGSRPYNRGYFRADIVKGATPDDRLLIRQMDPQQFDFALFVVDVEAAQFLKKQAQQLSTQPTAPARMASFKIPSSRAAAATSDGGDGETVTSPRTAFAQTNLASHSLGEETEGNANCTLPSPLFCQMFLRAVQTGKAKALLWRCCELYTLEKNILGLLVCTTSEVFVGFRESDKFRGRPSKPTARTASPEAKKRDALKKKKSELEAVEVSKGISNVPLPPDATPLTGKEASAVTKLFAFENKSRNPLETKKILLISLSDESTVSHMVVEVVLSLVDDLTEIHKPKQLLSSYRHNTGTSFPMFAGTTFYDPDTTVFNGYTVTATSLSGQPGDVLRFASLAEQRATRELLQKDRFAAYRKKGGALGLQAAGEKATASGGGGGAPASLGPGRDKASLSTSTFANSVTKQQPVPVNPEKSMLSSSTIPTPRSARMVSTFFAVEEAGGRASPAPVSPRNTTPVDSGAVAQEDSAATATIDTNEPYEFVVDEATRTVYWLQRHTTQKISSSSQIIPENSPSSSALYHSVMNPATGFVAFQGTDRRSGDYNVAGHSPQSSMTELKSQPSFRRQRPKQSPDRQHFSQLCELYADQGSLRPVAMLLSSVPSAGGGEGGGLKKTKSTMKSAVNLKRVAAAADGGGGGGDGESNTAQGIKLKILTEDSDIDEEIAALEDITPPVNCNMLEALTSCILYTSQIPPLKMKPTQHAVQLKLTAPGAEEDSKAKYSFTVNPAHFQFPDFKPCVFRRRIGAAHPFARFTMSSDLLFKAGFMLLEIKDGFEPECDVIRMADIGLNTTLRQGTKLVTVFKDVHVGTLYPIDVRKVTLPDGGGTEDRPRGFVLQFDSTSRATSNILQIFARSFSYTNLAPKPNAKRKVCVTLCDGGYFEATSCDVDIDVDHDEDTVPFEFGASDGIAVHVEKEGPTRLFSDLSVQPQSSQMKMKLVPPSFLSIEGAPGDVLRLTLPLRHQQLAPADSQGSSSCEENVLLSEAQSLREKLADDPNQLSLDEPSGSIFLGHNKVASLSTLITQQPEKPPASPQPPSSLHPGRHRGTTVGFLEEAPSAGAADTDLLSPSRRGGESSLRVVSPSTTALDQKATPAASQRRSSSVTGSGNNLPGRRIRTSTASVTEPPSPTNASATNLNTSGFHQMAPAPSVRPTYSLRIEFEKFPLVVLQQLLGAVHYMYDAQQVAPSAEALILAKATQRSSKINLRDSEKGLAFSRPLSVTVGGSSTCGLTPAGQPLLHMQSTVDVCTGQRLFYFNGKPTGQQSASSSVNTGASQLTLSSSSRGSNTTSSAASFGESTNSVGNFAASSEGLPWCIQGIDNELLPYMQVNCWASKFTIDLVDAQGLIMSLRNSSKATTVLTTSGLVADEAARPVGAVEFGDGNRRLTLLPLPGSNRIAADVLQRLVRNVLLSDALPADTNAVMSLTFETSGATRQEEMVRCTSRKQNLAPSTVRRQSTKLGLPSLKSFKSSDATPLPQ